MIDDSASQSIDQSIRGNVTRIGNISGVSSSPTTVNNGGGSEELARMVEELKEQNRTQREQISSLTEIIKNLTAR